MKDLEFQKVIREAERKEARMASALARLHGWGLHFATEKFRKQFDYVLFDHALGLSIKFEQKNSQQPDFCIELKQGDDDGVFSTCKADRFLWHNEDEKMIYIFSWPELKAYVCNLHSEGNLDIRDYRKKQDAWNHDSAPTKFCILKKMETLEALEDHLTVYNEHDINF
jgi:hypothetical protein